MDIILHLLIQPGMGTVKHPEPAKRVLNHVPDNPLRSKELGHCRDLVYGVLFLGFYQDIFLLGDIVLVYPPDGFGLLPVILADYRVQVRKQRLGMKQPVREEEFGIVLYRLEEKGHRFVKKVTEPQEQVPEEFFISAL